MNIICDNLDEAIDHYTTNLGYRLDMIVPADAPGKALLSKGGDSLQLVAEGPTSVKAKSGVGNKENWTPGRAGMEYRDLIPLRLEGRLIASHIRLTKGGDVPDYVHYHKLEFQLIYCLRGRIKVVYEDQGEPFWLETGDCVLQPPKIRHRVLECTAGAEVIELGMPAEHETWVEHEMSLPNASINPARTFNGQRFVRHVAANVENEFPEADQINFEDFGIETASAGLARVGVLKAGNKELPIIRENSRSITFLYIIKGDVQLNTSGQPTRELIPGNTMIVPVGQQFELRSKNAFEALEAQITSA